MEQYLKEHMLTPEVIEKYGLKVGNDIIEIPIKDCMGKYFYSKYRVFNKANKYIYDKGSQMALFNADKLFDATTVWIVEGEFDAIALQSFLEDERNVPNFFNEVAVSSTGGAGSWNLEWNEIIPTMKVNILLDNDLAGMKGSIRLWELIPTAWIYKLDEKYKDVCEMVHDSNGNFRTRSVFNIAFKDLTSVAKINNVLSNLNEDDLQDGRNKEFNDLMRSKLGELYQKKQFENRRKVQIEDETKYTDISKLKEIPITNFIHFRSGVAPCIFHQDHNPSMHYNSPNSKLPNTVKCYSCGKFADVIECIIQLENVDFKGALEYLRNYHG